MPFAEPGLDAGYRARWLGRRSAQPASPAARRKSDAKVSVNREPFPPAWDPEVRMRGSMAIVWTEYDFHRNCEFSHRGRDAFQLTKLDSGWTITGGAYSGEDR